MGKDSHEKKKSSETIKENAKGRGESLEKEEKEMDWEDAVDLAADYLKTMTTEEKVGQLLRDIDAYEGYFPLVCALKLAPLVFTRPTELRAAQWKEFDLESGEWRIPAERMKMRRQHLVPLSRQAISILRELQKYSGEGKFLFPSIRTEVRPISDATMLNALRRMGYQKHEMSVHGFRSIASTLLNELGYNRDWIERQLAHGEQDEVRAAYNYAEYLPERRKMMQAWADYLDGLRNTQQKRSREEA